ncbi:FkbM family methyltransferase [Amycolatopsis sp., V23-08]|uniref:FkbM family methyltransferase n=1 Tax=Amycolatopsis heterodermiae TaxID=3110235 RepID=A0ABU5RCN4_9PSEU|nr:FkbM family methyltransferase [Amycolatopsis sp., V23-08]MEA5363539.1 FkbM family methyltransferase [Amycolatopsis sp., V23-08]
MPRAPFRDGLRSADAGRTLLKVDVEGAEADVLAGIAETDWPRIRQVVLETQHAGPHLRALLAARGFTVTTARPEGVLAGLGTETVRAWCRCSCRWRRRCTGPGTPSPSPSRPPRRWRTSWRATASSTWCCRTCARRSSSSPTPPSCRAPACRAPRTRKPPAPPAPAKSRAAGRDLRA